MLNQTEPSNKQEDTGRFGETIALSYLKKKGYVILDVNWRFGHKEIDIVARQANEIVVVEVKTREENYAEEPWAAVTRSKIRNIVEVAHAWLIYHKIDLPTRFDVISVVLFKKGNYTVKHFQGAFTPPVN